MVGRKATMTKYFYGGRIFSGSKFIDQSAVLIDSHTGLIEEFGTKGDVEKPKDAVDLSASNSTLLPGLVDAHMHFFGAKRFEAIDFITTPATTSALRSVHDLRNLLNAGFTAVRDLGSKCGTYLRQAVEEDSVEGPTIITAGRSLAQTGGDDDITKLPIEVSRQLSYSIYCDGADECRKAVREVRRDGANVIKVYASGSLDQTMEEGTRIVRQFSVEELKTIVEEAHAMGLRVAAHAYGDDSILNALEAGVDSIEHGVGLSDETAARIAKQGTFYVPTASVYVPFLPRLKPEMRERVERHLKQDIPLARKHGVQIAMGTDYSGCDSFVHGENYKEIAFLASIIGNSEALETTTKNGSLCLGLRNSGRIAKGFRADLMVVSGDPSKDIESLNPSNVRVVLQNGLIRKGQTQQ